MTVDLAALAKLSTEATPGPWDYVNDGAGTWFVEGPTSPGFDGCVAVIAGDPFGEDDKDGPFVAAASPDVVLALVRVALAADALRLVYAGVNIKSKLLSELFGAVDALDLAR